MKVNDRLLNRVNYKICLPPLRHAPAGGALSNHLTYIKNRPAGGLDAIVTKLSQWSRSNPVYTANAVFTALCVERVNVIKKCDHTAVPCEYIDALEPWMVSYEV